MLSQLERTKQADLYEKLLKKKPNPALREKLYRLQYDLKAFYYGPGYSGAGIYQWMKDFDKDLSSDIKTYDKKRQALMSRVKRFADSWKGKMEAGKGARHEYEMLKKNLGTPPPKVSDYSLIRRQIADWILQVK